MKIKKNDLMRLWDIALEIKAVLNADLNADIRPLYRETHDIENGYRLSSGVMFIADALRAISGIQPDLGYGDLLQLMRLLDVEVEE